MKMIAILIFQFIFLFIEFFIYKMEQEKKESLEWWWSIKLWFNEKENSEWIWGSCVIISREIFCFVNNFFFINHREVIFFELCGNFWGWWFFIFVVWNDSFKIKKFIKILFKKNQLKFCWISHHIQSSQISSHGKLIFPKSIFLQELKAI